MYSVTCFFSRISSTVSSAFVAALTCLQGLCLAIVGCLGCCSLEMDVSSSSVITAFSSYVILVRWWWLSYCYSETNLCIKACDVGPPSFWLHSYSTYPAFIITILEWTFQICFESAEVYLFLPLIPDFSDLLTVYNIYHFWNELGSSNCTLPQTTSITSSYNSTTPRKIMPFPELQYITP
jgi:hypothetical protein